MTIFSPYIVVSCLLPIMSCYLFTKRQFFGSFGLFGVSFFLMDHANNTHVTWAGIPEALNQGLGFLFYEENGVLRDPHMFVVALMVVVVFDMAYLAFSGMPNVFEILEVASYSCSRICSYIFARVKSLLGVKKPYCLPISGSSLLKLQNAMKKVPAERVHVHYCSATDVVTVRYWMNMLHNGVKVVREWEILTASSSGFASLLGEYPDVRKYLSRKTPTITIFDEDGGVMVEQENESFEEIVRRARLTAIAR